MIELTYQEEWLPIHNLTWIDVLPFWSRMYGCNNKNMVLFTSNIYLLERINYVFRFKSALQIGMTPGLVIWKETLYVNMCMPLLVLNQVIVTKTSLQCRVAYNNRIYHNVIDIFNTTECSLSNKIIYKNQKFPFLFWFFYITAI